MIESFGLTDVGIVRKLNQDRILIDDSVGTSGQGPRGAVFVIILMVLLLLPMLYYLRSTIRAQERR